MSSFNCEYCGTAIIDTPSGYITECVHYKADCTCFEAYTCVNHRREAIEKLNNLADSQVDMPPDFRIVLNELASNSLDVNIEGEKLT